jgi:transketolase
VVDVATIKPLDTATVITSIKKTGCAVVAEEHNMAGGLGELIAGVLAASCPRPLEYINGKDRFGQSGTPAELLAAYGMDALHIAEAARKAIGRK